MRKKFTLKDVLRLSFIVTVLCFFTLRSPSMPPSSATAFQPNSTAVFQGTENNEVIGVSISAGTSGNATSFTFNTTGTTNTVDIANAKLWCTVFCPSFMSSDTNTVTYSLYGTGPASPNGAFTITGSVPLVSGKTYYFWLTFDVVCSSSVTDVIDAQCTSLIYNGSTLTPSTTNPAGSRTISAPLSPNIVPNPDFEVYTSCPTMVGQPGRAAPWYMPTTGTSDYCNACAPYATTWASVPQNSWGTQAAYSGNGYGGVYCYNGSSIAPWANYREYLQTPLSTSLVAGNTYTAQMYVNAADNNTCGVDKIGMYFSAGPLFNFSSSTLYTVTPQVSNTTGSFLNDKVNWVLISGTFTAAGGENYLTIGNFSDDPTTIAGTGCVFGPVSYYYVDNVSVQHTSGSGSPPCGALPSGLLSLTGYTEGNDIIIQWITANGVNNAYFIIERSKDGKTFEVLSMVKGSGNSNAQMHYSFTDEKPFRGTNNYYRLKQADFDGNYSYSQTISVMAGQGCELSFNVYPNPACSVLSCKFLSEKTANVRIRVADILGNVLLEDETQAARGSNLYTLNTGRLPQGIYFVTLECGNKQLKDKFIKQ